VAVQVAEVLLANSLPESTLLNVNVPAIPASDIKGIKLTRAGKRRYSGALEKRSDPTGRDYYWLGGDMPVDTMEEGTDVKAVGDGYISITPVHLDLTDHKTLDSIKHWGFDQIDVRVSGED